MKKIIIGIMLLSSILFGDCVLISSTYTGDNKKIKESSFYGDFIKRESSKEVIEFDKAYVSFLSKLSKNAISHCLKNGYSGIFNVRIQSSIATEPGMKGYYFNASLDYIKE